MKTLLLAALLLAAPGGERERALLLYREGKFAEAAAAFRAAIVQDGDSAELQWNLALASWRAGDLATAEIAAEKYAALERQPRTDLHAGLLGAVRHDEAKSIEAKADAAMQPKAAAAAPAAKPEDPLPMLEQALDKAKAARDHFVRGATAQASPELLRNTERALRTIDALQQKIDELKKQREQQEQQEKKDDDQQDQQKPKDGEQDDAKGKPKPDAEPDKQDPASEPQKSEKPDDKKDDKKADEKKADDKKGEQDAKPQPGQGEEKPEPRTEPQDGAEKDGQPKPAPSEQAGKEPEAAKSDAEPKPGERNDAPGENVQGKELTPEQAARLFEQLRDLDQKQKTVRARAKTGRRAVERDW